MSKQLRLDLGKYDLTKLIQPKPDCRDAQRNIMESMWQWKVLAEEVRLNLIAAFDDETNFIGED